MVSCELSVLDFIELLNFKQDIKYINLKFITLLGNTDYTYKLLYMTEFQNLTP